VSFFVFLKCFKNQELLVPHLKPTAYLVSVQVVVDLGSLGSLDFEAASGMGAALGWGG
jgi:hypothetical protein